MELGTWQQALITDACSVDPEQATARDSLFTFGNRPDVSRSVLHQYTGPNANKVSFAPSNLMVQNSFLGPNRGATGTHKGAQRNSESGPIDPKQGSAKLIGPRRSARGPYQGTIGTQSESDERSGPSSRPSQRPRSGPSRSDPAGDPMLPSVPSSIPEDVSVSDGFTEASREFVDVQSSYSWQERPVPQTSD